MRAKQLIFVIGGALLFSCGLGIGFFIPKKNNSVSPELSTITRQKGSPYHFTNPLLECEQADDTLRVLIRPFGTELDQYIAELRKEQKLTDLGVQFRDLLSGLRYGYNDDFLFNPASLLKVPLLMAHLKKAEEDPTYFQKKVIYTLDENDDSKRSIVTTVEPTFEKGKEYTIQQLINAMITYSSNNATTMLGELLTEEEIFSINKDLNIDLKPKDNDYTISVSGYASFFRILYNASYLSPKMSEYALELLTHTTFKGGLIAGVPTNIPVAHKFGERILSGTDEKQLHDCGIVYHEKRPYLLCIMTKGKEMETLEATIKSLSSFIYSHFDTQFQSK